MRPGISESEHLIDIDAVDEHRSDLQIHGRLSREILGSMARIGGSTSSLSAEKIYFMRHTTRMECYWRVYLLKQAAGSEALH